MKIFETTADLAQAHLKEGQIVWVKDVNGKLAAYVIKTSGTGVPLANGNVAVLESIAGEPSAVSSDTFVVSDITEAKSLIVPDGSLVRVPSRGNAEYIVEPSSYVPVDIGVTDHLMGSGGYLRLIEGDGKLPDKAASKLDGKYKFSGANPDLVSKVKELGSFNGMYIKNESSSAFVIGFGMGYDEAVSAPWGVEYRFVVNGDNLLLLRGVYSGLQDLSNITVEPTLTGTFNLNGAPNSYTLNVGDKMRANFTGSRMFFSSYTDDRGGLWKVTLSDGQTRNISTYASTPKTVERLVFDNLPHDTYSVEFEFLGDDPFNPPSSGTGTARGWFTHTPADTVKQPIKFAEVAPLDTGTRQEMVSSSSIPDFAISAKPSGAAYGAEWVPQHSGVTGVSTGVQVALMVDSERVSNLAGQVPPTLGGFQEISDFKILQRFNAENPNGSDGSMWKHWVSHTISKETKSLKIENRLEILQQTEIGSGYLAMLPASADNVTRMLLNDSFAVEPVPKDGSSHNYGWGVTSAMYAGEHTSGRGHGVAITVSSLREASSLGSIKEPTDPMLITYRADGVSKIYWTWMANQEVSVGDVYTCATTYTAVSGIRSPMLELRTI